MNWLIQTYQAHPGPTILTLVYAMTMGIICVYGAHRLMLLVLYLRRGRFAPEPRGYYRDAELPRMTVQLPMFNEGAVAERIIDAACKLDYPADRLQIQVIDDSTDHSAELAAARVGLWRRQGIDVQYIHRTNRRGFKAGAMHDAMPQVTGDLIAIFDADFVPEPDFLRRCVHHFRDPKVGLVQTRWDHLNREHSILTRTQAIFLDGHFLIEHAARNRSGRWVHFNGTGGIWRRSAIEEAGGWSARTLSEDLDLAIRAQLKGWNLVIDPSIDCPSELPPEVVGYKTQQHRWAKGTVQCLKHLYPKVLASRASLKVKLECFFQFTWPLVSVPVTLTALLPLPMMLMGTLSIGWANALMHWVIGPLMFVMGSLATALFYASGQRVAGRSFFKAILQLPWLVAVGYGVALTNTRGVIEALLGHESAFLRTPKYSGVAGGKVDLSVTSRDEGVEADGTPKAKAKKGLSPNTYMPLIELVMGLYVLFSAIVAFTTGGWIFAPFLVLIAAGYLGFGLSSLGIDLRAPWVRVPTEPETKAAPRPGEVLASAVSALPSAEPQILVPADASSRPAPSYSRHFAKAT